MRERHIHVSEPKHAFRTGVASALLMFLWCAASCAQHYNEDQSAGRSPVVTIEIGSYDLVHSKEDSDDSLVEDARSCLRRIQHADIGDLIEPRSLLGNQLRLITLVSTTSSYNYLDVRKIVLKRESIVLEHLTNESVFDSILNESDTARAKVSEISYQSLSKNQNDTLSIHRDNLLNHAVRSQGIITNRACYFVSVVDPSGETNAVVLSDTDEYQLDDSRDADEDNGISFRSFVEILFEITDSR